MRALILAAGEGKRAKALIRDKPKPLVGLLGLSLIERVILTAKKAGIKEFVVMVGYLGETIKRKLGRGEKYGVKIDYVENEEWERGNGVSVLKAKEKLKENFVLLMGDHVFEEKILEEMMKARLNEGESVLGVDREVGGRVKEIDIGEATKVKVKEGRVVEIGKDLKEFNRVDMGIFLCSPGMFKALERSVKRGDESLSGGVGELVKEGKIRAVEVNGFWADVDTKERYKAAERGLLKRLVKPSDGLISRHLNRPVSTRITRVLLKSGITPNVMSGISFLIGVMGAVCFALGGYGGYFYVLMGGLLVQFCSVLDGCDGEIARLKFRESDYGGWMDRVLDRYADGLIILGMVMGYWFLNGGFWIWLVGFIALLGCFMNSYTAERYDTLVKRGFRIGRDWRLFLIFLGALFNQVFWVLVILGVVTNIEAMRRLVVLRK